MCGRFTQPGDIEIIRRFKEQYGLQLRAAPVAGDPSLPPPQHDTAIARPYNNVWVAAPDKEGELRLAGMYWQLIHYWCEEFKSDYTAFNTRLESLGKRHNLELLERRRCVLPALSFFETKKTAGGETVKPREAYEFARKDHKLIALGGIYAIWRDPGEKSDRRLSCSIITLEPNEIVAEVHPRMPFVLDGEALKTWLDHSVTDSRLLKALIKPSPSDELLRLREV